jgi:uncharacterized repeat protein (TIGR03803 family)
VVFEVTPDGTETVLHSFTGQDGANPLASLVIDAAGNLYGTTSAGGRAGDGVVFTLTKRTETVLHHFSGGQDGAGPASGLVFGRDGKLYGTTQTGGGSAACQGGCGTVFRTDPSTGRTVVVHTFQGAANGDGANPVSPILVGKGGTLFGTTYGGGSSTCRPGGCGTVFTLSKSGVAAILLAFDGDKGGANPEGGLIQDRAGHLFGTATFGGTSGGGIAFRLDATTEAETVLHAFGAGTDGSAPVAGMIFTPSGELAGATRRGGKADAGTLYCLPKAAAQTLPAPSTP